MMNRNNVRLAIAAFGVLVLVIAAVFLPMLLFGPLGLNDGGSGRLQAILTYIGVMITAAVTLVGLAAKWHADTHLAYQQERQLDQLRLDAAMRAGQLFLPAGSDDVPRPVIASGLLALTRLERADLAVALLVDLWSHGSRNSDDSDKRDKVSTETAILVIDAALRSKVHNTQLMGAELLCRNATRLRPGQSLHWPSLLEGHWEPEFGHRTKLLIVEALVNMTLECASTETALRSAAVRLYGIWRDDQDERVRGCVGKLIYALLPRLERLGYEDFMQGDQRIMLSELKQAGESRSSNPDGYLDHLSTHFAKQLETWANSAKGFYTGPGCLAAGEHGQHVAPTPHKHADKTYALAARAANS